MGIKAQFQRFSGTSKIDQANPRPEPQEEFWAHEGGASPILLYPSDIGQNTRNANYVLFTTYKNVPAKFSKANLKRLAGEEIGDSDETAADIKARVDALKKSILIERATRRAKDAVAGESLHLRQRNFTISGPTIGLYMPATVEVKYGMQYEDQPIGVMSEAIYGIIKDIQAGTDWGTALGTAGGTTATGLIEMGLKTLDALVPGTKDLVAMERGTIIAPRTEVMFQGIGKRDFSFNFTFIPKSRQETEDIDAIIKAFKMAMTPSFKGHGTREIGFPDMFQIEFMHQNNENQYVHKIGRCFCETATVSYGGEKFITFEPDKKGAPPNKITLALAFKEIEVMDKSRIAQGY